MVTIEKKYRVNKADVIRYQLVYNLVFVKKLDVTQSDIELLVFIVCNEGLSISKMCTAFIKDDVTIENIVVKTQVIRNKITKLIKRGLVVKEGNSVKVSVEDVLVDPMLLTYKFLFV